MKKTSIHIILLTIAPIFICGIIYLLTRPNSLIMYKWLGELGFAETIEKFRIKLDLINLLPNWIILNLPALIWTFSFTITLGILWNYNIKKDNLIILLIPSTLGILLELFQRVKVMNGTFDKIDIFLYLIGGIIGLLTIKLIHVKSKIKQL